MSIGLAISGGGFRAVSFGLGCLRALHDRGILDNVSVISGISGGGLLTALYAYGPSDFDDFDDLVNEMLFDGLQMKMLAAAMRPDRVAQSIIGALKASVSHRRQGIALRRFNRTNALRDVLAKHYFGTRTMPDTTHTNLATVITATDLRTGNAMRFGSLRSSCSTYGIIPEPIMVAEAVAASAAFPFVLPAVERTYTFHHPGTNATSDHTLFLTDGGVYDNLGLSVLEPGRSAAHTPHVYDIDVIIACDAGRGKLTLKDPHFLMSRLRRSADITHKRSQDAARGRLHEARAAGRINSFIYPYLGMPDNRLPVPMPDLVPLAAVQQYGTNFRAMSIENHALLSTRGEQLTRSLIAHYSPNLS